MENPTDNTDPGLASAAFLRWKSRAQKKSVPEPVLQEDDPPKVRDRAVSLGGGIAIAPPKITSDQDFLDIAVPLAWSRFNSSQIDAKIAAAVNMKELLRAVRLKKKTGGLGLSGSSLRAAGWTDDDEKVVEENLRSISVAFDDIAAFYNKMGKREEFRGGRVLMLLDKDCRIKDSGHHIFPVHESADSCVPDLFSDEIFESWYKTGEIFKELLTMNPLIYKLAQKYGDDDTKKIIHKKLAALKHKPPGSVEEIEHSKFNFGNTVIVELAFSLKENGEFDYCMCGFFDDLGMSLSQLQRTRWLVVLNRLNSERIRRYSDGALRRTPTAKLDSALLSKTPSGPVLIGGDWNGPPPKQHLACYRIAPRITSPYLFRILDWLYHDGDITVGFYFGRVKQCMSRIDKYLAMLHEKAMNPMNLGLRALLVPLNKPT